jgi:hypothetical protein
MGTQKQKKSSKKKAAAVLTAGVLGLATAGGAYAYWTSTGGGTGAATTRSGTTNILSVTGDVSDAMYPGDSAQTVTATITNDGSENYKVQGVSAWVSTDKPGCDGSDYRINGAVAPTTSGAAVPLSITQTDLAPNGTTTFTYTMQFNNKGTVQNACKGAAVSVHYIAS